MSRGQRRGRSEENAARAELFHEFVHRAGEISPEPERTGLGHFSKEHRFCESVRDFFNDGRLSGYALQAAFKFWLFTAIGSTLQRAASCITLSVFATFESRAVNGKGSGVSP